MIANLRRVLEVLDIETFLVFFFFFLSSFLQKTMTRKENAKLHRVLVVAGAHLPDDLVFVSRDPGENGRRLGISRKCQFLVIKPSLAPGVVNASSNWAVSRSSKLELGAGRVRAIEGRVELV